jgi:hypothetical protein
MWHLVQTDKDVQTGQPLKRNDDKPQAVGRVQAAKKAPQNKRPPAMRGSQQPSKKKPKQSVPTHIIGTGPQQMPRAGATR